MSSLKMDGPFALNTETIDRTVTRKSAGNYARGVITTKGFIPKYVGRSDDDLKTRLKAWVGDKYRWFMYSYAASAKAAFEEECRNYHDFEAQLENDIHPDKPDNTDWKCPYCGK